MKRKNIFVILGIIASVSVVACGKPEDTASTVSQPTLMTEEASDSHDVEQQDLITTGTDAQTQSVEQEKAFTWKEKAGDNTLLQATADIELKAEPRDDAEVIATIPEGEQLAFDAICVSDDEQESDLGYAKLIYNEESKVGYIPTDENLEPVLTSEGETIIDENTQALNPDFSNPDKVKEQVAQQNAANGGGTIDISQLDGFNDVGYGMPEGVTDGVDHTQPGDLEEIGQLERELGIRYE